METETRRGALTQLRTAALITIAAQILVFSTSAEDLLGPAVTVWAENDAVFNTDRHYTHGSRVSYLHGEESIDDPGVTGAVARFFPNFGLHPTAGRWGLQVGQNLYTPTELHDPNLQLNDRPYAAWLFGTVSIQRRGTTFNDVPTLDSWSADIGVVGPAAFGEELQNLVHRVNASGWEHQLENEPGIDFEWMRIWRLSTGSPNGLSAQFLPYGGLRAGTVHVDASLGLQVRFGWAIPNDFGRHNLDNAAPETGGRELSRSNGFHIYLMSALEGRAVAWNMFLDGNIWHDSHSVDKWPFVGDAKAGLVIGWKAIELAYIHVFRTQEFHDQPEVDSFGSVALSIRW
jgi:hypothetical protein